MNIRFINIRNPLHSFTNLIYNDKFDLIFKQFDNMNKVRRLIWLSCYVVFMAFSTILVAQDEVPSEIKKNMEQR